MIDEKVYFLPYNTANEQIQLHKYGVNLLLMECMKKKQPVKYNVGIASVYIVRLKSVLIIILLKRSDIAVFFPNTFLEVRISRKRKREGGKKSNNRNDSDDKYELYIIVRLCVYF